MANDPYLLSRISNCLYLVYTIKGNLAGWSPAATSYELQATSKVSKYSVRSYS